MSAVASFDLGSTIGAFEVGVLISYVIFGITSLQAYVYYTRSEDDPVALRLMIAFVWLCELAHAICIGQVLYTFTIVNYGVLSSLRGRIPAGLALSIVLSGVITAVVQGFFAYRIFTLSTTKLFKLIAISVWVSEAVYLGFSFAATILSFPAPNIQVYLARRGWLLMASWIMNLINDTTITLSLVVLLLQNRMRGLDGTIALVDRLVKWTIETGMVTSLFSIANLVLYDRDKPTFIWVAIQVIKARLFANSLLASLNSRATLRALSDRSAAMSAMPGLDTSANIAMTTVTFASRQEPEPELGLGTRPRELFESGRERERERGVSEEGGTAVDGDDERGELKVQGVNLNGRRLSGG